PLERTGQQSYLSFYICATIFYVFNGMDSSRKDLLEILVENKLIFKYEDGSVHCRHCPHAWKPRTTIDKILKHYVKTPMCPGTTQTNALAFIANISKWLPTAYVPLNSEQKKVITQKLIDMVMREGLPFSIVDHIGLKGSFLFLVDGNI